MKFAALFFSLFVLAMLTPASLLGQDEENYPGKDLEMVQDPNSNSKFYFNEGLKEGVVIKETNEATGIDRPKYDTRDDRHRWNLLAKVNADFLEVTDVVSAEINYGYQMMSGGWFELMGGFSQMTFASVAKTNAGLGAESEDQDLSSDTLIQVGLGMSYRSRLVQHFLNSPNFFETLRFYGTYNMYEHTWYAKSYAGPGLSVAWGFHRRTSRSFHYGIRVGHHFASLTRAAEFENERRSDRTLVVRWTTFGLDASYYF